MKVAHLHSFTYSASDATITATCGKTGCDLTDNKATLTIKAPESLTYDSTEKVATVDCEIPGVTTPTIIYTRTGDTSFSGTPADAGTYTASITLGEATASVEYTIAKADPTATAPAASATYGQTLADVELNTVI